MYTQDSKIRNEQIFDLLLILVEGNQTPSCVMYEWFSIDVLEPDAKCSRVYLTP